MSTVIPFRRPRRECRCGYWFIPRQASHWLCANCYRWARIGAFVTGTRRQFEKLREAGR